MLRIHLQINCYQCQDVQRFAYIDLNYLVSEGPKKV